MNEPAPCSAPNSAPESISESGPESGPESAPDTDSSTTNTAAWLVYLLECADGTLYCGVTNNMDRRLNQHNGQIPGGARYTRGRRPVRLLASRACDGKSTALRLEKAVKSRARAHKLQFLLSGETA